MLNGILLYIFSENFAGDYSICGGGNLYANLQVSLNSLKLERIYKNAIEVMVET